MPRIYDSASNPIDFCLRCFPTEDAAEKRYGNVAKTGAGPDGRGNCFAWDAEHPDYQMENYHCAKCRRLLRERDNNPVSF